jgi:nitroreductase
MGPGANCGCIIHMEANRRNRDQVCAVPGANDGRFRLYSFATTPPGTALTANVSLLGHIRRRTSTRAIDPAQLPETDIAALLEAARWAPSWGNLQPWRIVVVRDPEVLAALAGAYSRGNIWAARAPAIFAIISGSHLGKFRGEEPFYLFDCGLAVQSLILEAASRSLIAHPFGGWDEQFVSQVLEVPLDMRVVVLVAVGREGCVDDLDEVTRAKPDKPQVRKPIDEIAFADRFGRPFDHKLETT